MEKVTVPELTNHCVVLHLDLLGRDTWYYRIPCGVEQRAAHRYLAWPCVASQGPAKQLKTN